jgi:hypothetical protein
MSEKNRQDLQDEQDLYHIINIKPAAPIRSPCNIFYPVLIEQPVQYYCPSLFLNSAAGGAYLRGLAVFSVFFFASRTIDRKRIL